MSSFTTNSKAIYSFIFDGVNGVSRRIVGKPASIFVPERRVLPEGLTSICRLTGAPSGPAQEPTRLAVSAPHTHIF
jgi:hypothetical protein